MGHDPPASHCGRFRQRPATAGTHAGPGASRSERRQSPRKEVWQAAIRIRSDRPYPPDLRKWSGVRADSSPRSGRRGARSTLHGGRSRVFVQDRSRQRLAPPDRQSPRARHQAPCQSAQGRKADNPPPRAVRGDRPITDLRWIREWSRQAARGGPFRSSRSPPRRGHHTTNVV